MVRDDDAGFRALGQVLAAEKQAAARLDDAKAQAARIDEEARHTARRIAERADARIQALHARFSAHLSERKARLMAAFRAEQDASPGRVAPEDIALLTRRLAARLTGSTD